MPRYTEDERQKIHPRVRKGLVPDPVRMGNDWIPIGPKVILILYSVIAGLLMSCSVGGLSTIGFGAVHIESGETTGTIGTRPLLPGRIVGDRLV